MFEVDRLDLDEREIPLAFFGFPHLTGDGVAGAQVETPYLARADVDVVRAGQVVVFRRAQEAEAVGQAFEHPFGEDQPAFFGLRLQDAEDQLLLAGAGGAFDAELFADLHQLGDAHLLELADVEARPQVARSGAPRLRFATLFGFGTTRMAGPLALSQGRLTRKRARIGIVRLLAGRQGPVARIFLEGHCGFSAVMPRKAKIPFHSG